MKKTKTLEIKFQSFNDMAATVSKALSKRKKLIQKKNEIIFDSIQNYRKFMTMHKIEILSAILQKQPSSIYELASFVDRNFAAVFKDCTALEAMGFIELKEKGDSKNSKIPALAFDYDRIFIDIPERAIQIEIAA